MFNLLDSISEVVIPLCVTFYLGIIAVLKTIAGLILEIIPALILFGWFIVSNRRVSWQY